MEVCGATIDFKKQNGYFFNADCMEGMRQFPDKYFDLAICDPPYGDGGGHWLRQDGSRFGGWFDKYKSDVCGGGRDSPQDRWNVGK